MNQRLAVILSFLAIYFIWGSTYLLNKIAVGVLPPFFLAFVRFFIAGFLLLMFIALTKGSIKISRKQLLNTLIVGFLFLSFGNGIVVWALRYVDSGFAALEIASQPLIILLLLWFMEGKKPSPMSLVGVLLGFIGIYLLLGQDTFLEKENSIIGAIMIFLCMLSWAFGSIFVSKADLPKNYLLNTGYQMVLGSVMLMVMSLLFDEPWIPIEEWGSQVIWVMLLLIIFGSIVAFTSFNYLLKNVSPEKVATSTYVNPIVAMLLGWYFLNEEISSQSLVAALVLLCGVYFVNSKRKPENFRRFNRFKVLRK